MTDSPPADRGNIVTYLDVSDAEYAEFRTAVVAGVEIVDPETEEFWVPVIRPDCELTLLDAAMIVHGVDNRESEQ